MSGRQDPGVIDAARPCAVVAFIDELSSDGALLPAWNEAFTGADPVTLVIHPGSWTAEQVSSRVGAIVHGAGIADDPDSVHLMALTGPLSADDDRRLAVRCAAVYGSAAGARRAQVAAAGASRAAHAAASAVTAVRARARARVRARAARATAPRSI